MDTRPILIILTDKSHIQSEQSQRLCIEAVSKIETIEKDTSFNPLNLPEALEDLLTETIKPLFAKTQHSQLTSTGRKKLVASSIPSAARFSASDLFDEGNSPWKNGWCSQLLEYVLSKYVDLKETARKATIEAHFHLLVPPILQQIDDIDISYKARGCRSLKLLATVLVSVQSEIMKRTGLTDVFIDALRTNFLLLPTLTPEDDSITLFRELYPAYRALLAARFVKLDLGEDDLLRKATIQGETREISSPIVPKPKVTQEMNDKEKKLRQSYLTLLLRHQLLHSLSHLSTGTSAGGTISLTLSTLLIAQIAWIVEDMGVSAVWHLQELIPLLRNVMSDPFAGGYPDLLFEAVTAMETLILTCWARVRHHWWLDCLRAVVGCWFNVTDDELDVVNDSRRQTLIAVKVKLKTLAILLEDISGEVFEEVKHTLLEEEPGLHTIFIE